MQIKNVPHFPDSRKLSDGKKTPDIGYKVQTLESDVCQVQGS